MNKRLTILAAALLLSEPANAQGYQFSFAIGATAPLGTYGVGQIGRSARFSIGKHWPDEAGGTDRVDIEGYDVLAPSRPRDTQTGRGTIDRSGGIGFTWMEVGTPRPWRRYALYGAAWHHVDGTPSGSANDGPIVVRVGAGMRGLVNSFPLHVEVQAMTWLKSVGTALLIPVSLGVEF